MQLNKTKEKKIEDIQKELKDKTITHPFEDDLLDLKPFAETISNIVVSTKDPFVFSINSPYGTGKTFFLRRLHCLLELKGCMCVSYNAWESDFYDNPLPAIIHALERRTTTQKVVDISKQAVKNISKTKLNPLKSIIAEFSILFERKEKIYDDFERYQEAKEKFTKDLDNFVKKKKKKFVFIIDELDRCRPDYAVKTLETIKHFFNIPNIVFIIGVDRKQIESTVKVLYGANIDNNCDEYLRKFIDQDFYLPYSSIEHYIEFLCKEYLTEVLLSFNEDRHTFSILNFEKLFSDIPLYNSTPDKIDLSFILEVFCVNLIELCKFFNFSLRKQEQLVSLIKIFISSLNPKTDYLFPELICYFVSIRMFNYEYLKYGNFLDILTTDPFIPEDQQTKWQKYSVDYGNPKRKFPSLKNKAIKGDAIDFWREILKGEELKMEIKDYVLANFIDSSSFSKIKDDARKYLLLIKQLTILTTEN